MPNRLTDLARAAVPTPWRRWLRRAAINAPQRLRDLPADLASLAKPSAFGGPIPPPSLRVRVGQLSRRVFRSVGVDGSSQIQAAFARTRTPGRAYPDWLDFGCGCGRIARYVAGLPEVGHLTGVDVDADLVSWAARALPHCGRFATMRPDPPLSFPGASFDVVYAISIFTHYTEEEQLAWLDELRRILRPGGLLIATTIAPSLAGSFPGVSARDLARLEGSGFLCVNAGSASFNERAAFHSSDYLRAHWGARFAPRLHEPSGFVGYQDLTVWEKPAPPEATPRRSESTVSGP